MISDVMGGVSRDFSDPFREGLSVNEGALLGHADTKPRSSSGGAGITWKGIVPFVMSHRVTLCVGLLKQTESDFYC